MRLQPIVESASAYGRSPDERKPLCAAAAVSREE
jgi:hypothetical protein